MSLTGAGQNRGTADRYTCGSPLGDLTLEMGTLAICLGSNRFEKIEQTYGQSDVAHDLIQSSFSNGPIEMVEKFSGIWATTEFRTGDAVIFGMHTMHGATNIAIGQNPAQLGYAVPAGVRARG